MKTKATKTENGFAGATQTSESGSSMHSANIQNENPRNYSHGSLRFYNPERGFGFINSEKFGDVICFDPELAHMNYGDLVFFQARPSNRKIGSFVAHRVRQAYFSKDNCIVVDRPNSTLSSNVKEILPKVIRRIECYGKEKFSEMVTFNYNVGSNRCVEVTKNDKIIYAQRISGVPERYYKLVKFRMPKKTNAVTVFLRRMENYYMILTAYFGEISEPLPYDNEATAQSMAFWEKHALICSNDDILSSTITVKCPWKSKPDHHLVDTLTEGLRHPSLFFPFFFSRLAKR